MTKAMKIAIDLEGTLIAECGEFSCERGNELGRWILPYGLRTGARRLLRDLAACGHTLTLYSSGRQSSPRLWLWCLANRLPIRHIVTLGQGRKAPLWPPMTGQDLILDDDARHIERAKRRGIAGLQVTNHIKDWTGQIHNACLHPPAKI